MSPQGSSKHGPYRKPRADIYTVLLVIALLAILLGCLFLYFEVSDYPDKPPWSGGRAELSAPAPVADTPAAVAARPTPALSKRLSSPLLG